MEKVFEFNLNKRVYNLICRRIKSKSHLIELLVEISSLIISNVQLGTDEYGKCLLRTDNKRRIYFSIQDSKEEVYKYFSFNFPFNIIYEYGVFMLETVNGNVSIQSHHLAVIRALCSNEGFDEKHCRYGFLLDFAQLVEKTFSDLGLRFDAHETEINQILMEFILFEPGYIRFDYDKKNEDGRIHPLNHLDIFYSQSTTFKLGCSLMDLNKFIDILEPATECEYIGGR
ncbi:hypothetical protein [Peribacillus frigoritolerans]|uniref:hypothetical protein n=1 Tax=Peribacillus castrilensis TaxID=2897690 RepID=UPI002DD390F6|nr:hypothetical protein [Peribacillus castrilensis]